MPELPDIETVRRSILPFVRGKRITAAPLLHTFPGLVQSPSTKEFTRALPGLRILDVQRRAKYLIFPLGKEGTDVPTCFLVFHFRMTGHMDIAPFGSPLRRFDRLVIPLEGNLDLRFSDARKLGKAWLVKDTEEATGPLGPEPLSAEFTPQALADMLRGRQATVKAVLVDQTVLAGIGNIYADEALWEARIRPTRRAADVQGFEVAALRTAIQKVLESAIAKLEALVASNPVGFNPERYVFPWESEVNAAVEELAVLKVPRKDGKPCLRCGGPIQRVKVQSRGTYFCPQYQR